MNLLKKVRMFNLSTAALRTIGLILAAAGAAGLLIQHRGLGIGSITAGELLMSVETEPSLMGYVSLSMICQIMEACAVPLFAFLLVEDAKCMEPIGWKLLAILGLAVACQLPYNVLTGGSLWSIREMNPMFALALSLVMLSFFRRFPEKKGSHRAIKAIALLFAFLWSNLLGVAHGPACVILTATLWALRGRPNLQTFLGITVTIICSLFNIFYITAPAAFLLLHFYDGEQGVDNKQISCLIYPVCLLVFALLSQCF